MNKIHFSFELKDAEDLNGTVEYKEGLKQLEEAETALAKEQ